MISIQIISVCKLTRYLFEHEIDRKSNSHPKIRTNLKFDRCLRNTFRIATNTEICILKVLRVSLTHCHIFRQINETSSRSNSYLRLAFDSIDNICWSFHALTKGDNKYFRLVQDCVTIYAANMRNGCHQLLGFIHFKHCNLVTEEN